MALACLARGVADRATCRSGSAWSRGDRRRSADAALAGGRGVVFVLHRAAPAGSTVLDPDLTVTVDLLDRALRIARAEGYATVGLDEVAERLRARTRRPIRRLHLRRRLSRQSHRGPAGVPRAPGAGRRLRDDRSHRPDGALLVGGPGASGRDARPGSTSTPWPVRDHADARRGRRSGRRSPASKPGCTATSSHAPRPSGTGAASPGSTNGAVLDTAMLTWDELRAMAADPLVTIGAHGMTHRRLARLDDESARRELAEARARIEAELGRPVRHLAYPYGGPAACGPASSGWPPRRLRHRRHHPERQPVWRACQLPDGAAPAAAHRGPPGPANRRAGR